MGSVELQGLNIDHWRSIFNQYDHNNDGKINLREFKALISSVEYKKDIPNRVVKQIFKAADENGDRELNYQEFHQMFENPENSYFFDHFRHRYMQYVKFVVPRSVCRPQSRTTQGVEETDGSYDDLYSCFPPPVFMILMSLLEIVLFLIDAIYHDTTQANGPIATALLYDPHRRKEFWRYLTYMFVHVGVFHLVVNIFVQVMLGSPLEMIHKWRVLVVYIAGVVAGSLGTSICDPFVKLAGASGGVYSLITAHVATIIMNWAEMSYPLLQLIIILFLIGSDVGTAIYNRYILELNQSIGYAAHFFGALAGLLVGITVLRNIEVRRPEKILRWIAFVLFVLLIGAAIVWNAVYKQYFPVQYV